MQIAVIAIALNEVSEVDGWLAATQEADYRLVVDTGSIDRTNVALARMGVEVRNISVKPFRYDEAMNVALHSLPPDIDVCFRVDMDERPRAGWRQAIERAWTQGTTNLYHLLFYTPTLCTRAGNVFSRQGFHYVGAVHEALTWRGYGDLRPVHTDDLIVDHFPRLNKPRPDHLPLLRETVREQPHDRRARMLFCNELVSRGFHDEAKTELAACLELVGRAGIDAAHLYRQLAIVDRDCTWEYIALAKRAFDSMSNYLALSDYYVAHGNLKQVLLTCEAIQQSREYGVFQTNPQHTSHWTDDHRLRGPYVADTIERLRRALASVNA